LTAVLEDAHEKSRLPEAASGLDTVHELLIRVRLKAAQATA